MIKFNYKYANLKAGQTSQYKGINFNLGKPINAIYIKSPITIDNGNPFIESLPRPRTIEEIDKDYEIKLNLASGDKDDFTALSEISLLKSLRFKLPFHQKLENEMYTCLINSYRSRELIVDDSYSTKMVGNTYNAATDGFNLIGESGSGKSSALKILLNRYPQVINHHIEEVGDFKQIVYVVVSTSPNDNFNALYISIAKAIYNALGFVEPVYESMVRKNKSLGEKSIVIASIIEHFNIGMILIDEIQLMSFSSSKENSYTALAKLSNDTKVSISVIGLSQANKKMFQEDWTARRLGSTVQADLYCESYDYFKLNLKKLVKYNWLKYKPEITEEGTNKLFKSTNGAIAHLISFYMRVQLNNHDNDKQITLTDEYVDEIMNKYFSGLTKILLKKNSKRNIKTNELERTEIINKSNERFTKELNEKLQEAEIQRQLIEDKAKDKEKDNLEQIQYVMKIIKIVDPIKEDTEIIEAFNSIIKLYRKHDQVLSNEEALTLTLEKLKQPKKKSKKKVNNNPQQVKNFIKN